MASLCSFNQWHRVVAKPFYNMVHIFHVIGRYTDYYVADHTYPTQHNSSYNKISIISVIYGLCYDSIAKEKHLPKLNIVRWLQCSLAMQLPTLHYTIICFSYPYNGRMLIYSSVWNALHCAVSKVNLDIMIYRWSYVSY